MKLYILENRVPVKADLGDWNNWKEEHRADCQVAHNYVCGVTVETHFRGYDQNGAGYLFITKVTGSEKWKNEKYEAKTWDEAEQYHEQMCGRIARDYQTKLTKEAHQTHRIS